MFLHMMKQNQDLQKTMKEMIPNIGNNNNNLLIENYDLLSRDNVNKILYPHNNKNVNSDELGSTYYFGRIDNIKSELLSIPNITLEKSINSKRKTRRTRKSKSPAHNVSFLQTQHVWLS